MKECDIWTLNVASFRNYFRALTCLKDRNLKRPKFGKKKVKKKYLQAEFNEGILQIVRGISHLYMSFPFDSCLFRAVELFTSLNSL